VEVFDTTLNKTFTEYLGLTLSQFQPGNTNATPNGGLTLDFGVLSGWAGFISGSNTGDGSVQFLVGAGNSLTAPNQFITTTSKLGTVTNTNLNSVLSSMNTGINSDMNGIGGCNGTNPCIAPTAVSPGYTGSHIGTNWGGGLGASSQASGALGSSLSFYQFIKNGTGSFTTITPTQYANGTGIATWTLSAMGDLVYNLPGAPTVPLPAGLWLLGSGLLGLAGIGRKRLAVSAG
jgi:hypothetical protein